MQEIYAYFDLFLGYASTNGAMQINHDLQTRQQSGPPYPSAPWSFIDGPKMLFVLANLNAEQRKWIREGVGCE